MQLFNVFTPTIIHQHPNEQIKGIVWSFFGLNLLSCPGLWPQEHVHVGPALASRPASVMFSGMENDISDWHFLL